jgi:uncharacterized protein YbbC (DUF1343 family)
MKIVYKLTFYSFIFTLLSNGGLMSCLNQSTASQQIQIKDSNNTQGVLVKDISVGAENLSAFVPLLKNKRVGLLVNHTSRVGSKHLIDTLLALNVNVEKIFSPEHGFKGTASAGEKIDDSTISAFKPVTVISLYGKRRKPLASDLQDVDIVVFDLQDVGARFYTYISTMQLMMEACAEHDLPMIILDRPNPNGHYVDGPVLKDAYRSFVGMQDIPVVHGMTVGELALMINAEGWLGDRPELDLRVIKNVNYTHLKPYDLPVGPSPNLPDQISVLLYPSLCFFEGTPISIGRGTKKPFSVVGHPDYRNLPYVFIPASNPGAKNPKLKGEKCYGYDLSKMSAIDFRGKSKINLEWLIEFYQNWDNEQPFFNENNWFDKLAGTDQLRKQILAGMSEEKIRESWQADLEAFKVKRKKYLLYPDFE